MSEELTHKLIVIDKRNHPSIFERGINSKNFNTNNNIAGGLRKEFREKLEDPNKSNLDIIIIQTQNFALLDGELYTK